MYESELKLTAPDSRTLDEVLEAGAVKCHAIGEVSGPLHFLAVYYDTGSGIFEEQRCALRARKEGDRFKAAFKLPGEIIQGMSRRIEYECDLESWPEYIDDLPDSELRGSVAGIASLEEALVEIVTVDMQRRILNLELNGTNVELVTDSGTITAGGASEELHELELELKSGNIDEIITFGRQLQSKFNLWPSTATKYEIGLQLRRYS